MNSITFLCSILSILFLSSCNFSSPLRGFEKYLKAEGRCSVTFWKANDGSEKLTTQIECPGKKPIHLDGTDVSKILNKTELANSVYYYVGDWKDHEKKIPQNFNEEYRKWLLSRKR